MSIILCNWVRPSKVGRSRLAETENVGKCVGKWQMRSEEYWLLDFRIMPIFFFLVVFSGVVSGSTAPNEQPEWQHDSILMGAWKRYTLHHHGATAPLCPFTTSRTIPVTPASWWETIFTLSVLSSQYYKVSTAIELYLQIEFISFLHG